MTLDPVRMIAVSAIEPGAHDATGLRALFESILEWGILQPLIVRPTQSGRYEVLVGRKRFAAARSAGFTEVPCALFKGSDTEAGALAAASNAVRPAEKPAGPPVGPAPDGTASVLRELHAIRATIGRALALEGGHAEGLRQRVARELVQVELQRSSWIVDALLVFHGVVDPDRAPVTLGPLLRAAAEPFQTECRLAGVDVRLIVDPSDLAVHSREAQLRPALNCMIGAVLTSMHGARHAEPTLVIEARRAAGGVVLSVAQNVVPLQALVRLRSGARGADAPEGEALLACFAFEAARRAVEGLGGRVEVRIDARAAGGAVDLKFPSAVPVTAPVHEARA